MSTQRVSYETVSNATNRLRELVSEDRSIATNMPPQVVSDPFEGLTIALIGPNEVSRNEMARMLVASGASEVHAFSSYPPSLDEMPALLMETHNVVIIELDSNPEFALNLVESVVNAGPVTATIMVYSTKSDSDLLMRCMRAGAREFLVPPFDSNLLVESLKRAVGRQALEEVVEHHKKAVTGKLLTFMGAKGGTGVTTLACNLAVALAQHPQQSTLLIDLDLPFGETALNLGIVPQYSTADALQVADRLDSNLLKSLVFQHDSGLHVLAASGKLSSHDSSAAEIDKLLTAACETFDNVVVDIGSRLDLTETALIRKAHVVYLVTQAGIPELRNSNRLISQFFNNAGSPKLEVIINRHEDNAFGLTDADITRALTRSAEWKIPNDYVSVRQMQIDATPLGDSHSRVSREIRRIAKSLIGDYAVPEKKRVFNLFG